MTETTITAEDIQAMVTHWLHTPQNGYLGSGYGQNTKALLQLPQLDGSPEEYLQKLKDDVPILKALPEGGVNLYGIHTAPDRLDLVIEVAGRTLSIPAIK